MTRHTGIAKKVIFFNNSSQLGLDDVGPLTPSLFLPSLSQLVSLHIFESSVINDFHHVVSHQAYQLNFSEFRGE